MISMRARLFGILLITTGLVWLLAMAWIFFSTGAELQNVLDARLREAARMVSSLVVREDLEGGRSASGQADLYSPVYDRQLSCQIWTLDGALISKSDGAPTEKLGYDEEGFSETVVQGEAWRVYSVINPETNLRVMVGDRIHFREQLVNNMLKGLLLPGLLIMPILAGLIWLSIGRGLSPLKNIANNLSTRNATDLEPIANTSLAKEIVPVVRSLNGLFARVASARDRERNFTAFAAHELRTPLAGLKTQAQVALASKDDAIRDKALSQIVLGVDRTGRLVKQLLDIASIEAAEPESKSVPVDLGDALKRLRSELLSHVAPAVDVQIDDAMFGTIVHTDPDLLRLATRNLMENALHHTPPNGVVRCCASSSQDSIELLIEDQGPGIPEEELALVTERFFRGRFKAPVGSGLGLSIVELALEQIGARLSLVNKVDGGLSARITFPVGQKVSGEPHHHSAL
jgi:two-component system sensor histidine kinase QseC